MDGVKSVKNTKSVTHVCLSVRATPDMTDTTDMQRGLEGDRRYHVAMLVVPGRAGINRLNSRPNRCKFRWLGRGEAGAYDQIQSRAI